MDEAEFWSKLEYRVCREIDGLRSDEFQDHWCDGFIPKTFDAGGKPACIRGRVWIGIGGRHQEAWAFCLVIGDVPSREAVDWAALLPDDDLTGWLALDAERRLMEIKPRNAHPDRM